MFSSSMGSPRHFAALILFAQSYFLYAAEVTSVVDNSFAAQVDQLTHLDLSRAHALNRMLKVADKIAEGPIIARPYTVRQIGTVKGSKRFGRETTSTARLKRKYLSEKNAAQFALASFDVESARGILKELPFLAAAYRLQKSPRVLRHLTAQLEEVVTWIPFQRPGWTLPYRKEGRLSDVGDGVWLATGTVIQALALTLDILPQDALSGDLCSRILQALEREMKQIEADWREQRPWYIRARKVESNQWIVPSSGLVIAACLLGRENYPEAYALGVRNIEMSLAVAGADGAMSEGYAYGLSWSSLSLMLADRFMRISGDNRFADNPFFKNFPRWVALYFQPGGYVVNAFDGYSSQRIQGVRSMRGQLSGFAAISEDKELHWILKNVAEGPSQDFFGLLALARMGEKLPQPPTFGLFERSHLFVWRSSWDFGASGLWLRGGDRMDFHDHHDRGHLNFIVHGKPVLIEAGTPGYWNLRKISEYDSLIGHNVLQVGSDTTSTKNVAPVALIRADSSGGMVKVAAGASYPQIASWDRTAEWDGHRVTVIDQVKAPQRKQKLLFRWHLGSANNATIKGSANEVTVHVPSGRLAFPAWSGPRQGNRAKPKKQKTDIMETPEINMKISSNQPIRVTQTRLRDHLFKYLRQENEHTVIVIEVLAPVDSWNVKTEVAAL
jgi:hypothetical protein